jgi:uncharacterized glyoxalase superfamily protein PhnB
MPAEPREDGAMDIVPMLSYENGPVAMDWLAEAFGFEERKRWLADGVLIHGEMSAAGGGLIMLATPTREYESPRRHREHCATARAWSRVPYVIDGVMVYVDDIDAHFERAKQAGARMLSDIENGEPGSLYRVEDLEGHRWMFVQAD